MKEWIRGMAVFGAGIVTGAKFAEKILSHPLQEKQMEAEKFQLLYRMMGTWVELKQKGIDITEYFRQYGYSRIAIYGMSLAGQILYNELKMTEIQVLYAIDKNKDDVPSEIAIYSPEEMLPEVDIIVVSAISYYEEILDVLQEKVDYAIVPLDDIVYSLK